MQTLVNPFKRPGKWYKANLHCHTTISDGQLSPAGRARQYRRAGYDVLALTDHAKTNDTRSLSDGRMLVISGMEYHPPCQTEPGPYHLLALNIPHGFAFDRPDDANRCIAQVSRAGGQTILAHPFWCGFSYEVFRELKGLAAIEVYNATCDRHGRPDSENEWACALDHGMVLPAVATDDCHAAEAEDVFEAWTWLKMPSLSVRNVLNAICRGACYGSCGPKIHDFRISGGKVRLRCSGAFKINFIGGPGQGIRRRAKDGQTVRSFSIDVPAWPYVRAVVTDEKGRRAWTNPIFL